MNQAMQNASLVNQLKNSGYRITKARRDMAEIFVNSKTPISAKDILEILNHSVNKTTVYRELDFLESKGIITCLPLSLEEQFYELIQDHHHHLICEQCGRIERYDNCLVQKVEDDIQKEKGFLVDNHSMEFYGVCKDCQ